MTILPIIYHYPKKCEVLEASTIFSLGSSQEFCMCSKNSINIS